MTPKGEKRIVDSLELEDSLGVFAAEVRAGLGKPGQKELPCKYLYDEVGSALFEAISVLPEYGLTRADERILRRHAHDIIDRISRPVMVAELGSGSGRKTRWILEALTERQPTTFYHPIEISKPALVRCERELDSLSSVTIVGFEREYIDGLSDVVARRKSGQFLLVLFLGSAIGNFDRAAAEEFLAEARRILVPGDSLLLGADLVKPVPQLIAAYDDPTGITAAFNRNLIARINRELDANFALPQFQHAVKYDPEERRIEMHLRSVADQTVTITRANMTVTFREDETIWTESCHKYSAGEIIRLAAKSGFRCEAQWVDQEWPFAENLLIAE